MNKISVSITPENTKKYPLHRHGYWEIMYYLSGNGYLALSDGKLPFCKGSIIIVPPETVHGSVSEDGFVNISIGGAFDNLLMLERPTLLSDNTAGEGEMLARLIFSNRGGNAQYLSALCSAYVRFLLQNTEYKSAIGRAVSEIICRINEDYSKSDFDISYLLKNSGYAEDYIRAVFKRVTGMTPVAFLTKVRIEHAQRLLEIYGEGISVAELGTVCGFEDSAYFSKRFKREVGISPDLYRKKIKEK